MVDRLEIFDPEPIVEVGVFIADCETEFSDRLLAPNARTTLRFSCPGSRPLSSLSPGAFVGCSVAFPLYPREIGFSEPGQRSSLTSGPST